MSEAYDLIVIGSGMGGYVAAIRAAQLGLNVAVVERQSVLGGTCLNWGCIPTKALLEHAHAFKVAQQASEWGITFSGGSSPSIDMARVHERKDKIVQGLTKGVEFLMKKNKITRVQGSARLVGGGQVEVRDSGHSEARVLSATEILVATGSVPRSVPGIAVDGTRIITSNEAIHLPSVPASMAILGAGAVGVEFASMFAQFGSQVTLIEMQPRLVPNEDAAVSTELDRAFRKRGIGVRTATQVASVGIVNGGVSIVLRDALGKSDTTDTLVVETLLVATGRGPNTDGLGAGDVGLAMDRGFVIVDESYRTSVDGISAIGDVITTGARPHPQLAHLAAAEGVLAAERIAGKDIPLLNYDHVPACTYCEPEIGSVGLSEKAALERGFNVKIGTFPFSALGRAKIAGEAQGFVKIVAEAEYDQVLGVHIIGPRATELIAAATTALQLESTVEEIVRTIHAHPTMSEALGEAAHAAHGAAIHL